MQYTDLTIAVEPYRITSDTAELVIDNKDDKPINVEGIEIDTCLTNWYFEGSGSKEYVLKFGNNEILTPKSYDISNYKEYILDEGYDILNIREIVELPRKEPETKPPEYDYKLILTYQSSWLP